MNKLYHDDGTPKYVTLGDYLKAKAKRWQELVKQTTDPKPSAN